MFAKYEDLSKLDAAIDNIFARLKECDEASDEYNRLTEQLSKLYAIKNSSKRDSNIISADTLATIAGNLAGIFIITQHEQLNVITSKAFSLLLKLK